jgi:hypothetical protein
MSAADGILRGCGVKREEKESALEALARHAHDQKWRKPTLKKWRTAVKKVFMEVAESAFDSLAHLNQWLTKFGLPKETTAKKARAALRTIHINIFDLLQNQLHKTFRTLQELKIYSRKNKLFYPLEQAKSEGLREFLRRLR